MSLLVERLSKEPHQWQVIHGVHYDSLVLGRALCDTAQARLHDVMAVKKLLLRT